MPARRVLALLVAPLVAVGGTSLADPPQRGEAGPPVSYSDVAHDAYRLTLPGGDSQPRPVPNPSLSNPALDLLEVGWSPASGKRGRGGYSTAVTVTGTADEGGSYVSWGSFTSGNDTCQLYHFLTPGITAFANAFCDGPDGERRFVGRVPGSRVLVTPTPSGGTQLSAAFDSSRLPAELVGAGSTLVGLSAFTCMQGDEGLGCRPYEVQDEATSTSSYRLA